MEPTIIMTYTSIAMSLAITRKKINKHKVVPLKIEEIPVERIKGYTMFAELYANIFMIAKKKSGKTCSINTILKTCSNKKTKIIVFCSTVHKCKNWIATIKSLRKAGYDVETHMSIFDDNGSNIVNNLVAQIEADRDDEEDESEKKPKERKPITFVKFGDESESEEEEKKEREPKKIAPEYILVFDDLSTELGDKSITALVKKNRHLRMKVIMSSQYWHDISTGARQQIDYLIMFPKIPEKKVQIVHQEANLSVPYDVFLQLYKDATSDKYNFLYIDTKDELFRKNFDIQYNLPEF